MANGWERLLGTLRGSPEVSEPAEKKPEVSTPEETPQGDSAVIQSGKPKRTRKTKPKGEQQEGTQQDA